MQQLAKSDSAHEGAVAVTVAILLTVLLLFAAVAVDLGLLRVDRSANQLAADMATAAAMEEYEPRQAGSAREACLQAVAYAEANTGVDFQPDGPGCNVFPEDARCTDAETLRAEFTGEDDTGEAFTLSVANPVFEDDSLMGSQPTTAFDGVPCDRIGVSIERTRDYLLAGIAGFVSGQVEATAVGRGSGSGDAGEFASLVILQEQAIRTECETLLSSSSNTHIEVDSLEREEIVDGEPVMVRYPGVITLDTRVPDEGCSGQGTIISLNAGALIYADDHIFSYALQRGDDRTDVYDEGDVAASEDAGSGLWPEPEPGHLITRAPVDHVYNCLSSYPDETWSPHSSDFSVTAPIEGCDESDGPPPFLRELHDAYQDIDADSLPSGDWAVFPDEDDDDIPDTCTGTGGDDVEGTFGSADGAYAPDGVSGRKWFIDCPGSGGNTLLSPNGDVHFDGVDVVVASGYVDIDQTLSITGSSDNGGIFYLQNGNFEVGSASGEINFTDTFVYIDRGEVRIDAQASLSWRAPLGSTQDACDGYSVGAAPPAGCFSPLALWSNSDAWHRLGGGGGLDIAGSFFTPNAQRFRLRGFGGQTLDEAQFFTAALDAGGQGTVTMVPNPDTNIEVPLTGSALLR